jgi:isopenicillin-N epimerase
VAPVSMNRRDFARLFALGGSAALLGHPAVRELRASPGEPLLRADGGPDWAAVRAEFLIPRELAVLNAANLCPSSRRVLDALQAENETLDSRPLPEVRSRMTGVKESVRDEVAEYLGASPEEILLTRNTSESNNWVSAGLELGPGDEVVILADNHPSAGQAWRARGERFGFTVREIPDLNPHPGPEAWVQAVEDALTSRTRVVAFSHLTNTVGDLLPAEEICGLCRDRGILTLVDGAQTFGLLAVDLGRMDPDFYTGSAHKWPCGPKEVGILFVNRRAHSRLWPSVYSAYPGGRGISRTHEALGQRDEPALHAFGVALRFLKHLGPAAVEARSRELADAAVEELARIDGVHLWTSPHRERRAAVVSFRPGALDPRRVLSALEAEGVAAAVRGGEDRPGIRFSPHFYNDMEDVERGVAVIRRLLRG